jgi:hypothetical protein
MRLDITTRNAFQILCDAKNGIHPSDMRFTDDRTGFPMQLFIDGQWQALKIFLYPDGTWSATYQE